VPANSVGKRHFLLSWSIRPRQASTSLGADGSRTLGRVELQGVEAKGLSSCKVSRAKRLSSVEPKNLLKTPGTWFESLLPNRDPK